mmetsp:Transcript_16558/g.42436  ORF Transcript_16558/g.42436 Transcript_16558/m.42436 type:complete len:310 (+) Transcript_16558:329-1258(+)
MLSSSACSCGFSSSTKLRYTVMKCVSRRLSAVLTAIAFSASACSISATWSLAAASRSSASVAWRAIRAWSAPLSAVSSAAAAARTASPASTAAARASTSAVLMAARSARSSPARAIILLVQLVRASMASPFSSSSSTDFMPALLNTQLTTVLPWTRRMPMRRSMAMAARWGEFSHTLAATLTAMSCPSSPYSSISCPSTSTYLSRAMRVWVKLLEPATSSVRSTISSKPLMPPSSVRSCCSEIQSIMPSDGTLLRTIASISVLRFSTAPAAPGGGSPRFSTIGLSRGCGTGLGGSSGTNAGGTDCATRS